MTEGTTPNNEADWTVTIAVRERDGQTRATARLQIGDYESEGVGLSRLSPAEHGFAGIGGDLAVARALSDLSRKLSTSAGDARFALSEG